MCAGARVRGPHGPVPVRVDALPHPLGGSRDAHRRGGPWAPAPRLFGPSASSGRMALPHAVRGDRHRLEHHARAGRRARCRPAARRDGPEGVHPARPGLGPDGAIGPQKVAEVADAVATQVRLAEELDADAIRIVATAAMREAANREDVVDEITRACGLPVEILSEQEEGRLAFVGATRTLGHVVEGEVAVVDVGGGSTEIVLGSLSEGVRSVSSFKIGSGSLTESFVAGDPPVGRRDPRAARARRRLLRRRRRSTARSRRWRWAAARRRCARSSGRCSSTRRSSARSGS